jgi:uncharacterized membrane protein
MSQAIWSATQGKPLVFTQFLGSTSRLAGHAEVFYFLLAPLYALFPRPETLLIVQAFFYAAGAIPVHSLAKRRLQNSFAALALSAIYLLYPVAQTAVLFDIHGDTFAMPLLLFAIDAADRRSWRSYALWIALALSCKYYIAVPVILLGLLIWWRGDRRAGLLTAVPAAAWLLFTLFGLKLLVYGSPQEAYSGTTIYLNYYFGNAQSLNGVYLRMGSALLVYVPALLLGLRSLPWLLLASSIAVPALLGKSFQYIFHHYAAAVPFLIAAIIYGAEKMRIAEGKRGRNGQRKGRNWKTDVGVTLLMTVVFNALFVNTFLSPWFYMDGYREYLVSPRDEIKDAWLQENVSPTATVAATAVLAPHIANRDFLLTQYYDKDIYRKHLPGLELFALDAFFECSDGSDLAIEQATIKALLQNPEFALTNARDGLLLFQRSETGLHQQIQLIPDDGKGTKNTFGKAIGLKWAEITPLSDNHFNMRIAWTPLTALTGQSFKFAVSRIIGHEGARILHLPSYALMPTTSWTPGQTIIEEFDFHVPDELQPGRYPVMVGWYDSGFDFDANTDAHNRIGEEVYIGNILIP